MSHFKKTIILLFVLLFSNVVFSQGINIEGAWIREAPPVSRVQAAYAIFNNEHSRDTKIISASSPAFKKIEFHETISKNGLNKMLRKMTVTIPHKESVVFKPEGLHMMLFNPVKPLRAGEKIAITFTFENKRTITTNFVVKKFTGTNIHQHMKH